MRPVFLTLLEVFAFTALVTLIPNDDLFAQAEKGGTADGSVTLFDGQTIEGWDGNPKFWSVEDGAITGQTTTENPAKHNTFLIWRGGTVGDFVLTVEYKIIGHNSGIQYRSREVPGQKWVIGGHQADFEAGDNYSGIHYEERGRGILALRGEKRVIGDDGKPQSITKFADSKKLQSYINKEDWNTYQIIAVDQTFIHSINGHITSIVIDKDDDKQVEEGLLALQLHAGPPMKVQFRNFEYIPLDSDEEDEEDEPKQSRLEIDAEGRMMLDGVDVSLDGLAERLQKASPSSVAIAASPEVTHQHVKVAFEQVKKAGVARVVFEPTAIESPNQRPAAEQSSSKNILFIAGGPSHSYATHEHRAGCLLLAKALDQSGLPVETIVVTNGWPDKASVFKDVDTVVIYADGGAGHPAVAHLDRLRELADHGVGIVCIHYAVEVPKGEAGQAFLKAIGGYFEANWSVNPFWSANFDSLPEHPITRGVEPFQIRDEWYYHMRFRDRMRGVTPILSDLPPGESLSRPDGPHSGNPAVRRAVAKQVPQPVAWACERKDGGRGFGFTGGHIHWNWGNNEFRQLVLNAIAWTAHLEVPANGVPVRTLTVSELEANQDMSPPPDYNPKRIEAMLEQWNR